MTTRSKGKLKIWLLGECVMDEIRGSKPPTNKTVYLHFRSLHGELQENEPGTAKVRNSAKTTVEHVIKWWLCRAGIPTKTANQMITMVLKMHNDWRVLFKQRLKTTQLQLDKRKAFLEEMKRRFWAP